MEKIKAKIIADSISPQGSRITSYLLTYPRFIHSELMTHRMFSRNSASSRAIPVKKMIGFVRNNMFTPLAVQKAHKGMQGSDYFEGVELEQAIQLWIESAELALQQAEKMEKLGITKQLINRILEPYQYYQVLLTGTEFENFFELRCPHYAVNWYPSRSPEALEPTQASFKSRKDAIKYTEGECNNWKEQDWRDSNESQAEIHIQALAEAMWDAMNESTPRQLKSGEWHLPFSDKINDGELRDYFYNVENNPDPSFTAYQRAKLKISTARCARLSYMTFDGEIDYEKDLKLHDTLLESHHMSPFEHCARAMSDEEYLTNIKGRIDADEYQLDNEDGFPNYVNPTGISIENSVSGWCRNYKGFKSYRQILEEC